MKFDTIGLFDASILHAVICTVAFYGICHTTLIG